MALGSAVLTLVTNPASAGALARLAAHLARPDDGTVIPVTVVSPRGSATAREEAERLVIFAEEAAQALGVASRGLVAADDSVATAVLDAAEEREATLIVMGWQGASTMRNVFGEIIDSVVGRSSVPLAVARLQPASWKRLLVTISDDHMAPGGAGGVELAASLAWRLRAGRDADIRVLRTGAGQMQLPPAVSGLSDRVHHDPRRIDQGVGGVAGPDDLVVVPVAPTPSGLRSATTHIAWAAPHVSLLVVIDVGPVPAQGLATAVSRAGEPAPAAGTARSAGDSDGEHCVIVTARWESGAPADVRRLADVLTPVGQVGRMDLWYDDGGIPCLRFEVHVSAPDSNQALVAVMTAMQEAAGLHGAEIRYDLLRPENREPVGGDASPEGTPRP